PGNIPYPAWFADVIGLSALVLLARVRPPMLAIGCLWGVVFAFKQNTGVLGIGAAAVATVLMDEARKDDARWPAFGIAVALALGAPLLLREYLDPMLFAVFVVPLLPLVLAVARRQVSRETVHALVRLGVGFAGVAAIVIGTAVALAGGAPVWTDFLQI